MMLRRIALGLAVIILVVAGAGTIYLRSSLPVTEGTRALPGLQAPVHITRDAYGIPTVRAANEHDADFALGFLHAQDRLFQMDMMRRYGAGRLSEVFGARTLGIDRTMRTLGLYRAAAAQFAGLSPAVQGALEAYAAGVNAFAQTRRRALPPEYYLLHMTFEPWRPADSLVWGKIMDLALTGNYRGELLRARLLQRLTPDQLAVLYPPYPKGAPVALGAARALYQGLPLERLYGMLPPGVGPQAASNNWVVDGAHSQSGKPLLANDPHLDFAAPGVWYLARIETPGLTLAGVTAPGTPFVIIGHNEHIAWGFTTTGSDVEDLFIERPDPTDPSRYLAPAGPLPFITRQEAIAVRGGAPVTLTVRETRHGPVISDVAGAKDGEVLALQTTWLGPTIARRRHSLRSTTPRIGPPFGRRSRTWSRRSRTSSMPTAPAISASPRPPASPSALRAMAGCRSLAGTVRTTGPAMSPSMRCPARSIRPPAASSPPTTRSCRTIIPISSRAIGSCPTAPSGSRRWSRPCRSNRPQRAPRSRPMICRSPPRSSCR